MNANRLVVIALLSGLAGIATAETTTPSTPDEKPPQAAKSKDCSNVARHDHAMDKGYGRSIAPCRSDAKAEAASAAKRKNLHDHGKFNKQQ